MKYTPKLIDKFQYPLEEMCSWKNGFIMIENQGKNRCVKVFKDSRIPNYVNKFTESIIGLDKISNEDAYYIVLDHKHGNREINIIFPQNNNIWKYSYYSVYSKAIIPQSRDNKISIPISNNNSVLLIDVDSKKRINYSIIPWKKKICWPIPFESDKLDLFVPNFGFGNGSNGVHYRINYSGETIFQKSTLFGKIFPLINNKIIITNSELLKFRYKTKLSILNSDGDVINTSSIPDEGEYSFNLTYDHKSLLLNYFLLFYSKLYLIDENLSILPIQLDRFIHRAIFLPDNNKLIMHDKKKLYELQLPIN